MIGWFATDIWCSGLFALWCWSMAANSDLGLFWTTFAMVVTAFLIGDELGFRVKK